MELKFRAWDGFSMTYIDDLYWFEENGVHDGSGQAHYGAYQIMQYTGLEDINGIPIYEGDIVQFLTFGGNEVVAYAAPCFIAGKHSLKGYRVAVMGNIHENPNPSPSPPLP